MEELSIPILRENQKLSVQQMKDIITEHYPEGIPRGLRIRFIGEPSFNRNTSMFLIRMAEYGIFPIISTILPSSDEWKFPYVNEAINILNEEYNGTNGVLKLLIGSTSEKARKTMYGAVRTLSDFSKSIKHFPKLKNDGKIVITLSPEHAIDATKLTHFFDPVDFAVEVRSEDSALDLDYTDIEKSIKKAGFELYYEDNDDD